MAHAFNQCARSLSERVLPTIRMDETQALDLGYRPQAEGAGWRQGQAWYRIGILRSKAPERLMK
jgi:hypothetical protein